jgi:SAM-dependent methyltransferase
VARYLASRGYAVTGFDLSEAMLEIARREVPEAAFVRSSMEELELPLESVSLIVSFFAVIHVDRRLHKELFQRMFAWLEPGGVALLSLGAEDNPDERADDFFGMPMTWSHFDSKSNLALLRKAGFEIEWSAIEEWSPGERHLFVVAKKAAAK